MATFEQENQMRQNLRATLADFQKIKKEDLIRDDLGKDLNFQSGFEVGWRKWTPKLC
jgi:hypothetical protein